MAKENWLIDPGELDEYQRKIRELSIDESYVIKGSAGSGKTILALYRANDIRIRALANSNNGNADFSLVVFTKALKEFIRSGVLELGINVQQVIHYKAWDGSPVDFVIVDEAQDFTKDEIDIFMAAKIKSIMMYGDTQQQIYREIKDTPVMSIEEIAKHVNLPVKELSNNYRLPKLIADFASHLTSDKNLAAKCVKVGVEKPKLKKFSKWEDELNYIIEEIKTRNYTDVAILLPFNDKKSGRFNNFHRNIETVKEYFENQSFPFEVKMNSEMDLDFDTTLPKLMTYHSSKGLQFETVFIPFCDAPQHDNWFIRNYQNALYVALTRTYRNLYLTHSERLTPFFRTIPVSKYE